MVDYTFEMTTFAAAETEAITGVSAQVQRDWRRRKILPSVNGHARHDVVALAELIALRSLGERGIGPQIAKKSSELMALGIALAALGDPSAIAGSPINLDVEKACDVAWHVISSRYNLKDPLPIYFVIWANGSHHWTNDIGSALSVRNTAARLLGDRAEEISGAVIIVDTYALGDLIRRRAGRPLVTVHQNRESDNGKDSKKVQG
jgi:hypothetical protein